MRLRIVLLSMGMLLLLILSMGVIAQDTPVQTFTLVSQIGDIRPTGIRYDRNFDRFVWVDKQGALVLVDAKTLQPQFTLYESGAFNAYEFSHDGRYLALAIQLRVEIWDTQTGQLVATFEPEGSLGVTGPLYFSEDDILLQINSIVPAPQETRRSETDTNIIPYLVDVRSLREEATTTLPNRSDGYAFFNYRNGLVLGGQHTVVAGVPQRIIIADTRNPSEIALDIAAPNRFERDPLLTWRSLNNEFTYVQPNGSNEIYQISVDEEVDTLYSLPLSRQLGNINDFGALNGFNFNSIQRILAEQAPTLENSLYKLFLGDNYRAQYGYEPVRITLLDVLIANVPDVQNGLLVFIYDESSNSGSMEIITLNDTVNFSFSPDNQRLMVRRASGGQPIEIYNLDTGMLERTFLPAEFDFEGRRLLDWNALGNEILIDFQRFDSINGDILLQAEQYTDLDNFEFSGDNQNLLTNTDDGRLRVWDVNTGEFRQYWQPVVQGNVLRLTEDGKTYITWGQTLEGTWAVERYNIVTQERSFIPLPDSDFSDLVPNFNLTRFIAVSNNANTVRIFDNAGNILLNIASHDLPGGSADNYGWYDNDNFYIYSTNLNNPQALVYGIEYHPSGLPQCMVDAYPNDWMSFLDLWERFSLQFSTEGLNSLTQRICTNLPAQARDFTNSLTPTPATPYFAEVTPRPFVLAGVPTCLTRTFTSQALQYAELWRAMSAGLDEEATRELEQQLCEGLISNLSGVQPTATIDPNTLGGATPTPLPDAPDTVDNGSVNQLNVMLVNVNTGERSIGDYVPQSPFSRTRNFRDTFDTDQTYIRQTGANIRNTAVSPDGQLYAVQDNLFSFIRIYRLGIPFPPLFSDTFAQATSTPNGEVGTRRDSIGIPATATQAFVYADPFSPTLTPTVTLTPYPTVQATVDLPQLNVSEEVCPHRNLFTLENPPQDFSLSGRMLLPPLSSNAVWIYEPMTNRIHPNESVPRCQNGCDESPDGQWIIRYEEGLGYSRLDGTGLVWLYNQSTMPYISNSFWEADNTLVINLNSYYPDTNPNYPDRIVPTLLTQRVYPETGEATELLPEPQFNIRVNDLPTNVLGIQPLLQQYALVSTPFVGGGEKYYIYNIPQNTWDYFLRSDFDNIQDFFWTSDGAELFYNVEGQWYVYNPETNTHSLYGTRYGGTPSQDGRFVIAWFSETSELIQQRIVDEKLPVKLRIWDTQTGLLRYFCFPETGLQLFDSNFIWSPDNRYVVFNAFLPVEGDVFPVFVPFDAPTPTAFPTATPINLELEYQLQDSRLIVLDIETGAMTIINENSLPLPYAWLETEVGND
jgi:hypothetical protein